MFVDIPSWIAGLSPSFLFVLLLTAAVAITGIAATIAFLVTSDSRTENFIRIANVVLRPFCRTREHKHIRERKNTREEEYTFYFQMEPVQESHIQFGNQQKLIDQEHL